MRVLLLTNEYPPHIYGGAGVHVEYLSRELAKLTAVEVRSFHDQAFRAGQLVVQGYKVDSALFSGCPKELLSPLRAFETCLRFNGQGIAADVVHCHTWYAHFGGILARVLYGIPLVVTVHSLEPLRPWKQEQIGRGYDLSRWVEKTALEMADAVVAVSKSTRQDILRLFDIDAKKVQVIPNGVDTDEYKHSADRAVLEKYGIDPSKPYVLFVGRMTRQKGLYYLLQALPKLEPSVQVVLCAGESDTPALQKELEAMVKTLRTQRQGVVWIPEMVSRRTTIALYSQAAVFCCPSIYEPFGIINLEAMACGTPVVGSKVGGIAEVVVDGMTGVLVDPKLSSTAPYDPVDPESFAILLAESLNRVVLDKELRTAMAIAGRQRVEANYSWHSVAKQTLALYKNLSAQN
ncbi:Predicted glycogen synthase, ADP-glucose transglucosylase, Actinobacterial type [invertebrate metagenome]|uniref:Predicted glycogen synthase, ADP-glucose transglucosylase, Actinobacterial type n=1 Tax=invertebrate metagenome TaxID=1711999 RepID=A0A484H5R6_9ZZZZ